MELEVHPMERCTNPLDQDYETFLSFDTSLPCTICHALTRWGHLQRAGKEWMQFMLTPTCPQHGFAQRLRFLGAYGTSTLQERHEQQESIIRFVVAMHGGTGSATAMASVNPELAPGFHVWQRDDFESEQEYDRWHAMYRIEAWSVRYVADDRTPTFCVVVYDEEYTQFHLCSQDGSCRPPQHISENEV